MSSVTWRGLGGAAALLPSILLGGAHAADAVVVQKDRAFQPGAITINRGDQIVFKNADEFTHNVISKTPGQDFDLKLQKPGEDKALRFDVPGTVAIGCDLHPRMELTVTVK